MTPRSTSEMAANVEALRRAFFDNYGRPPEAISEAPGRVNLIGEHTDYNEGFVLPAAIARRVAVAAARVEGRTVRVYSADVDVRDEWQVASPRRTGRREWRDYVRGVAWALLDAGHELRGADLAISGDVPQGAGLSSSAALEAAAAGALCAVAGIEIEPRRLALLCQKAENQFVGVQCGIMDQLSATCSRAGNALLIDCRSLEMEAVPLPAAFSVVIVDSKVPRRLEETAYNDRRSECAEAARVLGVDSLRVATLEQIERKRKKLPDALYRRARHVITENARVLEFASALPDGNHATLGSTMRESHQSLRDDFEVSTPELDLLVELASGMEGVIGARLTGAGFGGSTVNLLKAGAEARFETEVVERYRRQTGLAAEMLVCRPVDGLAVRHV